VKPQQGMVLLLCLIFLTALTLLGLSASAEAILQKQLTRNLVETERARQSALRALSWAEDWLLNLNDGAPAICDTSCDSLKLHTAGSLPAHLEFKDLAWWATHGHEAGIDPVTKERVLTMARNSPIPPMWLIEVAHELTVVENGLTSQQVWYRITVRANGMTGTGVSVIESIVMRSWLVSEETDNETAVTSGRISFRELR
jgi:Tfp pilus assembly protein PilX